MLCALLTDRFAEYVYDNKHCNTYMYMYKGVALVRTFLRFAPDVKAGRIVLQYLTFFFNKGNTFQK